MDTSQLDRPMSQAKVTKNLVTLACASLLAFNAFHLFTGYQSFLRYKTSLESDPRQVERLVSLVYSLHPSLMRANLIDEQRLRYHFAGQMKEITNCFERSLALREEVYGKGSPKICRTLIHGDCQASIFSDGGFFYTQTTEHKITYGPGNRSTDPENFEPKKVRLLSGYIYDQISDPCTLPNPSDPPIFFTVYCWPEPSLE